MKWWISLGLLVLTGVGFYFRVIAFDPLSLVVLAAVLWSHLVGVDQRRQIADAMSKSQVVLTTNQREIAKKIEVLRTEIRSKR